MKVVWNNGAMKVKLNNISLSNRYTFLALILWQYFAQLSLETDMTSCAIQAKTRFVNENYYKDTGTRLES